MIALYEIVEFIEKKRCNILIPDIRKQPQTSLESI